MGKSSILRNLDQVARGRKLIVYADLKGETSFVASTADFLLNLADRIYAAARRAFPAAELPEPDPVFYESNREARHQFTRLTEAVRDHLDGQALILALDEFEAIEDAVKEGTVDPGIYRFLRSQSQEPWLSIIFGGLHTMDEMSRAYEEPFYGSYTNIPVSYLQPADARQLITNPTADFMLNYEQEAVARIIAESGGQPMLIQLICRDALEILNYELFDQQRERELIISLRDVETVLDDDFFRRGTVYFDGVWDQAESEAQRHLLRTLALHDEPWPLAQIATACQRPQNEIEDLLKWSERLDILQKLPGEPPAWQFHVPLMRRWISQQRSSP
jgi:hypothetical protein